MDNKFWSRIDIRGEDECWLFKNQPSQRYGVYNLKLAPGNWKALRPHRYAWEQYHKRKIPSGLYVCHSCDTPKCCNPNHLWLGTNSDNQLDAIKKFGYRSGIPISKIGEEHHSSKLTEKQVLEIRKRANNGERQIDLAKEYQVSSVMISKIYLRKSWKHI
jgi:hypothetical protein